MSPAGTSVSGPMWRIQFVHERLAEPHHFVVALALGIEIGAALAAAHRERRQAVLEHLLEGQELQHAEVDRRMEPQAALVGADGAVHLDAEAAVDLHLAAVVDPRHAEHDRPLPARLWLEKFVGTGSGFIIITS